MDTDKKKIKIIIFGASGAIGSYLAQRYFNNNELLLFVRNANSKKKLLKKFPSNKINNIMIDQLNVEKKIFIKKKIDKYVSFFKEADLIINATGDLGDIKKLSNINLKKFEKTLNINFFFNMVLLQKLSKLKMNKRLSIILFSGGGVTSFRKNFSAYSISKLALVKLVEIASKEMENKFFQINVISPGIIKSKMTNKTIKNKNLVSKIEINKIRNQISFSKKSLSKLYDVINFLCSEKGKRISGKLISSKWDNIENWSSKKIKDLSKTDLYSIRRVQ
jgi:short-subunit dehydrogenase